MKPILMSLSTATVIAMAGGALACGVCIEDKVAATYDDAVVTQAMAKHRQVVFVAIDGPRAFDARTRVADAARNVRGVEAKTLRLSDSPAAFSFVVERSQAPVHAVDAFRHALRDADVRLTLVRVMREGKLIDPDE